MNSDPSSANLPNGLEQMANSSADLVYPNDSLLCYFSIAVVMV